MMVTREGTESGQVSGSIIYRFTKNNHIEQNCGGTTCGSTGLWLQFFRGGAPC